MVMPRSRSKSIEFEMLLHQLAFGDRTGQFDHAVGKGRLAMIDMRDDAEVAYEVLGGHKFNVIGMLIEPSLVDKLEAEQPHSL